MKLTTSFLALLIAGTAFAQTKPAPKKPAAKPVATVASANSLGTPGTGGYEITVTLKPFKNQWIYLGHYYGKQLPIIDSAKLDGNSTAVFRGKQPLGGGIYLIGWPDRAHNFEILVDKQQKFGVIADTATLPEKLAFTNSADNDQFHAYQAAMSEAGREADALMKQRTANPQDSVALTKKLEGVNDRVTAYRSQVMTETPNSLLATLLRAMKDPEVPNKNPKNREDSLANYRFYKAHFFDGAAFYDERLARTPFFEAKVDRYIDQMFYPAADSVKREIDNIMAYAHINKEMEKFFLLKFVNRYMNMKYMWEDDVFVHIYEKYFRDKNYDWLAEKGKKIIQDRAFMLYGNLTGSAASDVELPDSSGKKLRLYDVQAPYTLLVIWDPTCSHCKETLPKLDTMYRTKWKALGMKMFGLAKETEGTRKDWTDFMKAKNLKDWINVYYSKDAEKERVAANIPSYSQLFDVQSFPTIYLLDKDKHIIAKKLTDKQVDEIIELREKERKNKAAK